MAPRWFKLLEQHRTEGRTALTPSFLVGALRNEPGAIADQETSIRELRDLLESMRDETPQGYHVRIYRCTPDLWQPVAAVFEGEGSPSIGTPIPSPATGSHRLYVSRDYVPNGPDDLGAIADALWAILGGPICEGKFSYRPNEDFQPFNEQDRGLIERALAPKKGDEA